MSRTKQLLILGGAAALALSVSAPALAHHRDWHGHPHKHAKPPKHGKHVYYAPPHVVHQPVVVQRPVVVHRPVVVQQPVYYSYPVAAPRSPAIVVNVDLPPLVFPLR